jgi:hypothetical protein
MSSDPRFLTLQAGPLTLEYDPIAGDLRYIRWGNHEIIRRLYGAVRNEDWFTIPYTLTEIERTVQSDSFRIVYDVHHVYESVDFRWRGTITGDAEGTVTFEFNGEAHSGFLRNRIGLCVLHPAEAAGQKCVVTHGDGVKESGAFPELISPHQPFFDIAALAQEIVPDVTATIRFTGDIFEMEDQRNWLDASFKTYSTPHALPKPVAVTPGTRVQQSIMVSLSGEAAKTPPVVKSDGVTVTVGGIADVSRPLIGLLLKDEEKELDDDTTLFLSSLPIEHFQAELDASSSDFMASLERVVEITREAGKSLIVSLRHAESLPDSVPETAEITDVWLVVPADRELQDKAEKVLTSSFPNLPGAALYIGGASDTNFTELNRERPDSSPGAWWNYVGFAGNPQVHAFDDVSILETPPTIATALRSARAFTDNGTVGLCAGPLTFYGTYQPDDPRQKTVLAALWYFAAITYAVYSNVYSITLCETTGPRGIVGDDGEAYPIYHLLHGFAEATQGAVCEITVSDKLSVTALAFDTLTGGQRLLVANLTTSALPVTIAGMKHTDIAGLRILSEETEGIFGETETIAQDADGTFVVTLPGRSIGWLHLEMPK